MAAMASSSAGGSSMAARALSVLGAYDGDHPRRTLSELARAAGLPLSTAHRLVAELVLWGALSRRPDGRYEIGRRIWDLGMLAPVSLGLRDVALPFLQDISAATGENAHLAVREGTSALYVERISGSRAVPIVSRSGSRLPLHATGVGKVLLAHAPEDVVAQALASARRTTPYTVVAPGVLRRQLADVRRRGYASTSEEMTLGTRSVAVPITDGGGRVFAALGIVVGSSRRDLTRLVPALHVAARGIARAVEAAQAGAEPAAR
jgi:DNA-binding IclR family transcriptional regulator